MKVRNSNPVDNQDPSFYMEVSEQYGWKLYSYLQTKIKDPKRIKTVYESVMLTFCDTVKNNTRYKNMDAVLYAFADQACGISRPIALERHDTDSEKGKKSGDNSIGFWIAFVLLLLLNFLCLWIIAGLLMDLGILPSIDLGYSWFCSDILPLLLGG